MHWENKSTGDAFSATVGLMKTVNALINLDSYDGVAFDPNKVCIPKVVSTSKRPGSSAAADSQKKAKTATGDDRTQFFAGKALHLHLLLCVNHHIPFRIYGSNAVFSGLQACFMAAQTV